MELSQWSALLSILKLTTPATLNLFLLETAVAIVKQMQPGLESSPSVSSNIAKIILVLLYRYIMGDECHTC